MPPVATLHNAVVSGGGSASFASGFVVDVHVHVTVIPNQWKMLDSETDSLFKAGWVCLGNNYTVPVDGVARSYWYDRRWVNWIDWSMDFIQTPSGIWANRIRWRLASGVSARIFVANS
jgi:hypothetical protein